MTFLVAVALTLAPTPLAPTPDPLAEGAKAMDQIAVYVHDLERAQIEATMAELAAEFGEWLKQITPPVARNVPAVAAQPGAQTAGGGGVLTTDRLRALSQCESGGQNGWRTGYFGIEAGYPIGNLSWEEQAAWANRIYAQYGARAWGCPV